MKHLLSNSSLLDFILHSKYKKVRYLVSFSALTVMAMDMIFSNIDYLAHTAYEALEWITYFTLMFGPVAINVFILIPRYLLKNRIVPYFVLVLIILFISLMCTIFIQMLLLQPKIWGEIGGTGLMINVLSSLVVMGLIVTGSSAIQLLRYWMKSAKQISELEAATLQSELDLLKSRINPHFLFNMLNNGNVLIWKNKEEARDLLYKLENLLRYQLKEAAKDKILLEFDIRFLHDFLNLEKIRRDNFELAITVEGDVEDVWIPSFLFIPFVENAIKHNPDSNHLSYVYLKFGITGNRLAFRCENSKPMKESVQKQAGGLGLKNIQRRLSLLYPGKHRLEIQDERARYIIILELELA